jgi:uncharacterized protein YdeI (YjbR/CyaY-like superfamily)
MAAKSVKEPLPQFFASPNAWRAWLDKNHAADQELWVGFYKRDSGRPSITWPEAVDGALCFGWIDGVRKNIDAVSYKIRFTPRKRRSIWSAINIKRARELSELGLMHAAGLAAFERRDGDRSAIYAYEQRKAATLPPEFEKLGILPVPTAVVSPDIDLLGDQREEGRDSPETARDSDRLLGPRT